MGLFKDIKGKTAAGGGRWLPPDFIGVVQVLKTFTKESEKKKGKQMFIHEFRVLSSNMEDTVPVGCKRSQIITFQPEWPELFLGNVNEFNFAVRCSAADIQGDDRPNLKNLGDDQAEELVSEEQPFSGVVLRVETNDKDTNSGGKFTLYNWSVPKDLKDWYEKAEEYEASAA